MQQQQLILLAIILIAFMAMQRQRDGQSMFPDILGGVMSVINGTATATSKMADDTMTASSKMASSRTSRAGRLYDAGWKLYGAEWCGWTKRQLALFEGDPALADIYVECTKEACDGISGYPTWKNSNGTTMPGYKDVAKLEEMMA